MSISSLRSPTKHVSKEKGRGGERGQSATQVHSQQALIRISFIQTAVFIEHGLSVRGPRARAAAN